MSAASNRFGFLTKSLSGPESKPAEATEDETPTGGETPPPPSPAPVPKPPVEAPSEARVKSRAKPETQPSEAPRRPGRPNGKRSNEAYTQITAYIQKTTHRDVKKILLDDSKGRDFSALVEELLAKWLKSRS